MKYPTFLGIGTPKSGSTWLHKLLQSHPKIWMPQKKVEVHYFDNNFKRGDEWYGQFFPSNTESKQFHQIGEFTPHYIYSSKAIRRIKQEENINKFIISFRNPVERAFSHYKFRRRIDAYSGSFEQFLDDYPEAIKWGYYGKAMERFLDSFSEESVLALVFEKMVTEVDATKKEIADFLEVDVDLFPDDAGTSHANKSFTPRFRWLYSAAVKTGKVLRNLDLYWLEKSLKNSPIINLLGNKDQSYKASNKDYVQKKRLYEIYEQDMEKLKDITDTDLSIWKQQEGQLKS